jgi:transcriptional regulator with XRE-family HTH domain
MNSRLVRMLRQINDISQYELADRLGCSRGLIARIETDRLPVSRRLEHRINDNFGASHVDKVRQAMRMFDGGDTDAND